MVADTDQKSKLLAVISQANQEAWQEIVSIIAQLEDYLETKYRLTINELEEAHIYQDIKAGEVLVRGNLRMPANTLDFKVFEFLKKSRILFASLANLGAAVSKLPSSAVNVLNIVSAAQAQTHFLLTASEKDLQGFKLKTKLETSLTRISTDLATIQRDAHALMERSLEGKAAAA